MQRTRASVGRILGPLPPERSSIGYSTFSLLGVESAFRGSILRAYRRSPYWRPVQGRVEIVLTEDQINALRSESFLLHGYNIVSNEDGFNHRLLGERVGVYTIEFPDIIRGIDALRVDIARYERDEDQDW